MSTDEPLDSEPVSRDARAAERLKGWLERGYVDDPTDAHDRALRNVVLEARREGALDDDARALAARRVTERVLAATVGGAGAAGGGVLPFPLRVRRALKSSIVVRVVAASLLVHLLALPAVAWYVLAPETLPSFVLRFLPAERGAGVGEGAVAPTEAEAAAEVARLGRIENRLRVDRYRLGRAELPPRVEVTWIVTDRPRSLAEWIALRIELRLGLRPLPASALVVDLDEPLVALAVLEASLDALALEPDSAFAARVAERARQRVAALAAIEAPYDVLAPKALARAAAYGVGPGAVDPRPAADGSAEDLDLGLWLRRATAPPAVRDALETTEDPWATWLEWAAAER